LKKGGTKEAKRRFEKALRSRKITGNF
jgi:hypothetical protein